MEQALRSAVASEARCLILWHLSRRYEADELRKSIQALVDETGYEKLVFVLRGSYQIPND